jgi:hypothetical protein
MLRQCRQSRIHHWSLGRSVGDLSMMSTGCQPLETRGVQLFNCLESCQDNSNRYTVRMPSGALSAKAHAVSVELSSCQVKAGSRSALSALMCNQGDYGATITDSWFSGSGNHADQSATGL